MTMELCKIKEYVDVDVDALMFIQYSMIGRENEYIYLCKINEYFDVDVDALMLIQ